MQSLLKGKKENGADLEAMNFIFISHSFSLFVIFISSTSPFSNSPQN